MKVKTYGAALLADIIENPGDDALRLIYADWLDENGQSEMADFIREQVDNARRYAAGDRVMATGNRELDIVTRTPDFLAVLGSIDNYGWNGTGSTRIEYDSGSEADFTRGFISAVRCQLAEWEHHGRAVCAAHPIERVTITDREPLSLGESGVWAGWVTWNDESFEWPGTSEVANAAEKADELPHPIFALVDGKRMDSAPMCVYHESRQIAHEALSAACILYARKEHNHSAP